MKWSEVQSSEKDRLSYQVLRIASKKGNAGAAATLVTVSSVGGHELPLGDHSTDLVYIGSVVNT